MSFWNTKTDTISKANALFSQLAGMAGELTAVAEECADNITAEEQIVVEAKKRIEDQGRLRTRCQTMAHNFGKLMSEKL